MLKTHAKLLQDLEDQNLTDCTFVFNENNAEKTVVAHMNFLALASPVFYATFFGDLKETGPIEITDITSGAFQKMIWIIYGKTVTPSSAEEACQLYYAAQKYDLPDALTVARDYMLKNTSESTVHEFYGATILHDDDKIIPQCCATVFEKAFNTTKADGFFSSTEPLEGENTFAIVKSENGKTLKASIKACMDTAKKESALDMDGLIAKMLELIRILTSETKTAFEFIIPHTMAEFSCSLNWIPPTGSLEDFHAACVKRINRNIVAKCCNGHAAFKEKSEVKLYCPKCSFHSYPFYPYCQDTTEKYGKKDTSAYILEDLKAMHEILKDFL